MILATLLIIIYILFGFVTFLSLSEIKQLNQSDIIDKNWKVLLGALLWPVTWIIMAVIPLIDWMNN